MKISEIEFKKMMEEIDRDCESVICIATAREVLRKLSIEVESSSPEPEIIAYNAYSAFHKLEPGTFVKGKKNTAHEGRRSKIKKFTSDASGWCVLLEDGGQFNADAVAKLLTFMDGSPCGLEKQ